MFLMYFISGCNSSVVIRGDGLQLIFEEKSESLSLFFKFKYSLLRNFMGDFYRFESDSVEIFKFIFILKAFSKGNKESINLN